MLGSRSARRQVNAILGLAADAGAYSVGFTLARGSLTGFTVYYNGDSSGGASRRQQAGFTRAVGQTPPPDIHVAASDARAPGTAAQSAVPTSQDATQDACAATGAHTPAMDAPAPPMAARRRRGCRGGSKHRKRTPGHNGAPESTVATMSARVRACAHIMEACCRMSDTTMSACTRPAPDNPSATGSTPTALSSSAAPFFPRGGKRVREADTIGLSTVMRDSG